MRNIPFRINKNKTRRADLYTDTAQECNDRNEEIMNAVESGGVALTPRPIITDPAFGDEDPNQNQLSEAFASIALAGRRFTGLVSGTTIILRRVGQSPILTPNALIEGMEVVFTVDDAITKITKWRHIQVGSIPPTEVYFDAQKTHIPDDFLLTQQVVRCVYLNGFFIVYSKAYRVYKEAKSTLLPIGDIQMKSQNTTAGWVPLDGRTIPASSPAYKRLKDSCTTEYFKRWGYVVTNTGITIPKVESGAVFDTYEIAGKYEATKQVGVQDHKHIGGHMVTEGMLWDYFGITDREESDYSLTADTQAAEKNWEFGFIDLPSDVSTVVGRYDGTEVSTVSTTTVEGGSVGVMTDVYNFYKQIMHNDHTILPPSGSSTLHLISQHFFTTKSKPGEKERKTGQEGKGDNENTDKDPHNGAKETALRGASSKIRQKIANVATKQGKNTILKALKEASNILKADGPDSIFHASDIINEATHETGILESVDADKPPGVIETVEEQITRIKNLVNTGKVTPINSLKNRVSAIITDSKGNIKLLKFNAEQSIGYTKGILDGKTPTEAAKAIGYDLPEGSTLDIHKSDIGRLTEVAENLGKDSGSLVKGIQRATGGVLGKLAGVTTKVLGAVNPIMDVMMGASIAQDGVTIIKNNMQYAKAIGPIINAVLSKQHAVLAESEKGKQQLAAIEKAYADKDYDEAARLEKISKPEMASNWLKNHDHAPVHVTDPAIQGMTAKEKAKLESMTLTAVNEAQPEYGEIPDADKAWESVKSAVVGKVVAAGKTVGHTLGHAWSVFKGMFSKDEQKAAESIGTSSDHHTSSTGFAGSSASGGALTGGKSGSSGSGGSFISSVAHAAAHAAHSIGSAIGNAISHIFGGSSSHPDKSDSGKD